MNEIHSNTINKDTELVATIKVCIISFSFACMTASIAGDVFSIWLKSDMGLTQEKIAELFSMKAMFAIFYKPIFGYLLDKFQLKKTFIIIIPILGVLVGPFFQYVYAPLIKNPDTFYLGGVLGGLFFGFVIIAGGAAIFNYTDRYIRAHGGTYGRVSAFNSAGWGVMGLVSSILYNINPAYNFDLASAFGVIVFVVILSLKTEVFQHIKNDIVTKEKLKLPDILGLFKNINFLVLISFVVFCTAISYIQQSQLGNYTATFWDTKEDAVKIIGYLAIPFSLVAFTVSLFSSRAISKMGVNMGIIVISLGFIVYLLIAGIAGFAQIAGFSHSKYIIIVARIISSMANPLFNVIILTYIAVKFDQRINGVTYLVGFHFINNLGVSLFGPSLGEIFDKYTFAQGYIDLAIISFIGLGITMTFMQIAKRKEHAEESYKTVLTH